MNTTSLTLLGRLQDANDREAWIRFVDIYTPFLYRWARRTGLSEQDTCDLVQDVFVVLVKKLPEFAYDPQKGRFRGWLRTITLNKVREGRRRKHGVAAGTHQQALESVGADESSRFWDEEYRSHLVEHAMAVMQRDFEDNTWKACWETAFRGRPAGEVAAELGMSVGAVYVSRSRVLRRLRQEMDGMLD